MNFLTTFMQPMKKDLAATKCGHIFHRDCITKALEKKPVCPLDRKPCKTQALTHLNFSTEDVDKQKLGTELSDVVAHLYGLGGFAGPHDISDAAARVVIPA